MLRHLFKRKTNDLGNELAAILSLSHAMPRQLTFQFTSASWPAIWIAFFQLLVILSQLLAFAHCPLPVGDFLRLALKDWHQF